ncbi:uncharacterized protein LOC135429350 [Drosophila montana]|uniref:uncharacterized protein LOC135429350 n=1 Tax=Drosophila montana TaxID=40370 RepID=UPI00313A7945
MDRITAAAQAIKMGWAGAWALRDASSSHKMRGHIWMTLLLVVEAQQLPPPFRYHSWFYATPWRPLLPAPAPTPGAQHLSLGYTGPQTFPGAAGRAQPAARRPVVLGLVRPARHQFMLPFRPSPFAGYSNEQEQQQQQEQEQEEEQHQEPLFHAPGYPRVTAHSKPIEEHPAEALPAPSDAEQHYLYMSAGNLYQLVRS